MTREEAIRTLKEHKIMFQHDFGWNISTIKALEMAISALSVPSANVISIDQANAMIKSYVSHYEENKGEWIAYDHGMGLIYLKCPFCGATIDKRYVEHNFCGKCGAKLSGEKSGFDMKGKSCKCNTCKNNDDELSGECYECVKGIFDHYQKGGE